MDGVVTGSTHWSLGRSLGQGTSTVILVLQDTEYGQPVRYGTHAGN